MKANTPGAVRNLDPEFVHDLRVATRRARFACRLFAGMLGTEKRDRLRLELSWIAGLLGGVRDLDVLKARVESHIDRIGPEQASPAAVVSVLEQRLRQRREQLVSALVSERYTALLGLLSSAVPSPSSVESAQEFSERRIGKSLAKLAPWIQRRPEDLSPEELHRLRILFKRLRYTTEFFRPILGQDAALLVRECVAYQDCLGMHQDARVALEVLTGLAQEPAISDYPLRLLSLGALIQVERDTMAVQRERFRTLWGTVQGIFDIWKHRSSGASS